MFVCGFGFCLFVGVWLGFFSFFFGVCVCWNAILMIFSIEIYCCSCQQRVSAEGKGMWIVGRLEVRGRWEPGKDCFLLYPVPRGAQVAVFLWHSLPVSLPVTRLNKLAGACTELWLHLYLPDTGCISLRRFQSGKAPKNSPIYGTIICRKWTKDPSLKFQLECCWGSLQFSTSLFLSLTF